MTECKNSTVLNFDDDSDGEYFYYNRTFTNRRHIIK